MRRRRQALQVSTFPFLAVLLCAMGSLILLLLVMDRRAKAVALAKAQQAVSRVADQEARVEAERAAEWERRRQALHAQLTGEDQGLATQVQTVERDLQAAASGLRAEQTRYGELQSRLQTEQSGLVQTEAETAKRQTQASEAVKQSEASRAELARMAADLQRLEQTLADLKLARQRDRQTYSLIPYKGKQGDNRRPLYVECTAAGLIFHPDHQALQGYSVAAGDIRKEVERRIARQRDTVLAAGGKPDKTPYLLLLVRPDGITSYYHTLAALKGIDIDFGYEFIERDWALDFPEGDGQPQAQPWMAGAKREVLPPVAGSSARGTGLPSSAGPPGALRNPQDPKSGVVFGGGNGFGESRGNSIAQGGQSPFPPGVPGSGSGSGGGGSGGVPGGSRVGSPPGARTGVLFGGGTAGGEGSSLAGSGERPPFPPGLPGTGGGVPGGNAAAPGGSGMGLMRGGSTPPPLGVPGSAALLPPPGGRGSVMPGNGPPSAGSGLLEAQGGSTQPGGPASPPVGLGTGASPGQPAGGTPGPGSLLAGDGPNTQGGSGSAAPPGTRAAGSASNPGTGAEQHAEGGSGTGGKGGGTGVEGGQAQTGEPANPGGTRGRSGGGTGSDSPGDPTDRMMPSLPNGKTVRPTRPVVGRLTGNRDYVITVECTADAVLVPATGLRLATASLAAPGGADALLQAVRQLIERRQASVRPGEVPYRPQIRFLVQPDGLRSYYTAYPALERLQLPMTRENFQPEDDGKGKPFQR